MANVGKAIKETFGDNVNDHLYIELLATSPAYQGRGYGSALMKSINDAVRTSVSSTSASIVQSPVRRLV